MVTNADLGSLVVSRDILFGVLLGMPWIVIFSDPLSP
jgi:hypothetical protein